MNNENKPNERVAALEDLWAAVKDWRQQTLGYTPKMAQAIGRIDNLERKTNR